MRAKSGGIGSLANTLSMAILIPAGGMSASKVAKPSEVKATTSEGR